MHFDETSASCYIFTFKEGSLSPFAHDLKIRATRFSIQILDHKPKIKARFDARSLRVECAIRSGVEEPGFLSGKDRETIDELIENEVLHASTYEEILFSSSSIKREGKEYQIRGELFLFGTENYIEFSVSRSENLYSAEMKIHQPDFGIRPFSAMMGTVRVKPDLLVRVSVPYAGEW